MANEFQGVIDQLDRLDGENMRRIQRRALSRVGEIVKDVVQYDCPVKTDTDGGLLDEGELKESIKARVHIATDSEIADGKSSRVVIGPVGHTAQTVANWVENGHVARRSKKKQGAPRFVPAHPFVRKAYDECHEAAQVAYIESVTEDIEKVMK